MVKICSYNYPKSNEELYKQYYENFSYELHDFQKWCVEAIVTGNHVLISAPTGTGKTFGGEFAIQYFHSKNKKVIYTSPIKALSNEKFYNFTQKFPHISFGLITGDIKCNPDADVLIMTTEILLNKLYQLKGHNSVKSLFEMDIENELGCVVFDEIHFISDESRGHVWEQSILSLPPHIQMVGLSATLDNPERFALWLEQRGVDQKQGSEKVVFLTKKTVRSVPLVHYSFIVSPTSINKYIKDKTTQEEVKKITNKLLVLQDEKNLFNDVLYQNIKKTMKLFDQNNIKIKRQNVLNKLAEHLVEKDMLPALCYVFSRKSLEECAEEMTTNLLEFDSKVPYTVDRECEKIIRKFPNFEEYLNLPEYINMVKLLRKGVGIHHAGLIPVLREMVEMLFVKGFIKMLFCTETMSVGINLPVKTTIFTDIKKFNGNVVRMLLSHEYTQSAGRAGRLGLDKIGHVIHLNNLYRNVDGVGYKLMMSGKPQTLKSNFKISYNLLLNLIDVGEINLASYAKRSLFKNDIDDSLIKQYSELNKLQTELDNKMVSCDIPMEVLEEYKQLEDEKKVSVNKKRREVEKKMSEIVYNYPNIDKQICKYGMYKSTLNEISNLQKSIADTESMIDTDVYQIIKLLETDGFIVHEPENNVTTLTPLGKIAVNIRELHCLIFSKLIQNNILTQFKAEELVGILSCFTSVTIPDGKRIIHPTTSHENVKHITKEIGEMLNKQIDKEVVELNVDTGIDYTIMYDIIDYTMDWCKCINDVQCKELLQRLLLDKEVFLGEFIKAIFLKINNMASELEKIAELIGNIEFLSEIKRIPELTMKYVATNQSLYV